VGENPLADHPLMECGCVAQGTDSDGNPVCVVHIGLHPGAAVIAKEKPSLEGRRSECVYCGRGDESDWGLPFFEYHPERKTDSHYNGCRGWS